MDLALLIIAAKSLLGLERKGITPPTSTAGARPDCGTGKKAVLFTNPDRWVCVPEFK